MALITEITTRQDSPAGADKSVRCKSMPKLLHFDVLTTLSVTTLVYLHSFSCCCIRNLQNPEKFSENSNSELKVIQGHRSWCQWKAHMSLHISH